MQTKIENWITDLKLALSRPLPSFNAHVKLAPNDRIEGLNIREWPKDARNSAVTFLIFPVKNELHTLVMKRTEYDGVHSGQISLPGGQKEMADKDLFETAIREYSEETGVTLLAKDYLGSLSDLYIPPSNFIVQPYVAYLNVLPNLQPQISEVQELHEISLKELFNPNTFKEEEILIRRRGKDTIKIKAPCYKVKGLCIWGATAMMISELQWILQENNLISLL